MRGQRKTLTNKSKRSQLRRADGESCTAETEIERGKTERKTREDTWEKERLRGRRG